MIKEKLFLKYLKWQARPSRVQGHLKGKNLPRGNNCKDIDLKNIKAGAVQLQLTLCASPLEYVDLMSRWVEEAAGAGGQLLAFPENNSFHLLGLLPGFEKQGSMAGGNDKEDRGEEGKEAAGDPPPLPLADVFRFVGPVFNSVVHQTFSYLAGHYGMYIMAGSFPYPQEGRVVNRSLLYGPRGELAGFQDKVHLMPVEHAGGLTGGESFHVFPTPLGKLAMPVCMDASYFETFRILRGAGVDIVMVPIFNPEPYNFWLALRGIWPRVQESLVYGIKSAMVGEVLGYSMTGRAGIFAPLELSPGGDGVLAELEDPQGEGLAAANLDLEALQRLRAEHPYLEDQNPALLKKYFPGIYKSLSK